MTTKGTYGRFSGKTRFSEGTDEGSYDGGQGTYERAQGTSETELAISWFCRCSTSFNPVADLRVSAGCEATQAPCASPSS